VSVLVEFETKALSEEKSVREREVGCRRSRDESAGEYGRFVGTVDRVD